MEELERMLKAYRKFAKDCDEFIKKYDEKINIERINYEKTKT